MSRQVDVGCGYTITPGYERLDINPDCPDLDHVADVDKIPVEDGTFSKVRASHVIEHVPLSRVRETVLPEWFRVLESGGTLWVDTPNIDRNINLYRSGEWKRDFDTLKPAEQERCSLNGTPNPALWLNFKIFSSDAQFDVHYWNATPSLLMTLLSEAGFVNVRVEQIEPSVIVTGRRP